MDTKARIRIYSLLDKGLSFSYVTDSKMIVVGGRYDKKNKEGLKYEMELMGFQYIDTLLIPSWQPFFCKPAELGTLLDELLPDDIVYTDVPPSDETAMKSYERVQSYSDGEIIATDSEQFAESHQGVYVDDQTDVFMLYLNCGNLAAAFFSQCSNGEEQARILNFFQNRPIDVLIGGRDNMDEGYAKGVVESLCPNTVVGRVSPSAKKDEANKILHVATEDLFISKVNGEVVRLKLGEGFPVII